MAQYIEQFLPVVQYHNLNSQKVGALSMPSGSTDNIDFSNSSGTFKTPSGTNTLNGNVVLAAGKNITGGGVSVMNQTTTTILTAAQSGSLVLFGAAAGFTITLPAPAIGLNFSFGVLVSVTSSNHKVITDTGTTLIAGGVVMTEAADTNAGLAALFNGTTHISILMNGSTTGGLIGTFFNMYCVTATQWLIEGIVAGSGTLATCASTS